MDSYMTLKNSSESETVIEKSRFIGFAKPTKTEADARAFIAEIRKAHPFATHNCYAYVAENGSVRRSSDDGEPQGTAGQPIAEAMNSAGVVNAVVVVTRYFGGIKLGAGGLTRAYAKAAKKAIDEAGVAENFLSEIFTLTFSYEIYDKIRRFFSSGKRKITDTRFGEAVTVTVAAAKDENIPLKTEELTCGTVKAVKTGERYEFYE